MFGQQRVVEEEVDYGYEDAIPSGLEETKRQLRRMSSQMNDVLTSPTRSIRSSVSMMKEHTIDVTESDEESIIEEVVYDSEEEIAGAFEETLIIDESIAEDETEVELVEEEDGLGGIPEGDESSDEVDEEEEEVEQTEVELEDEGEEDDDEDEDEDDEATEEEVKEAIVYILKQEKPIDSGHLTPAQATRMMALPFPAMKEIMKHFELCDNAGEPICWNQIAELVDADLDEDEDENDDNDDDDSSSSSSDSSDDEDVSPCVHGYGYCVECGVGLDASQNSSSLNESRDVVGSLGGSGFDLNAQDSYCHSSISFRDGSDTSDHDPKVLKEYRPRSPRSPAGRTRR